MRKAITGLVAIGLMAVLLLMSIPPAYATKAILTRAEVVYYEENIVPTYLNDRVIKWKWTAAEDWEGDWIGHTTYDCQGDWKTDGDPYSGGVLRGYDYHCLGTFVGTVLGKSGTVYFHYKGLGWFPDGFEDPSGWLMNWHATISGGTGDLEGIHGTSPGGVGENGRSWHGWYTGWYFWIHFE